jgi:hypothetical protein
MARDKGCDLSVYFTTDKDGNPRPQGPGWDVGAYEYTVNQVRPSTGSGPKSEIRNVEQLGTVICPNPLRANQVGKYLSVKKEITLYDMKGNPTAGTDIKESGVYIFRVHNSQVFQKVMIVQ